jgi:glycosyltransferase involved in cell wall biosynthesis
MLDSLRQQTHRPEVVVIVDSSGVPVSRIAEEFRRQLAITYMHHRPPSASAQRNAGIKLVQRDIEFIAFLDDDATLEPDALEQILAFWMTAASDVGGVALNLVNHPDQAMSRLKRSSVLRALGVYSADTGRVMPSGWQTLIGFLEKNTEVDWLPSTAAVWRSEILRTFNFDEFFSGYSYLEDLDFSYTVRRRWRLFVAADARYHHYPSSIRHTGQYSFGKTEVRNRLYFVRKHDLSTPKCWLGLILRTAMTIFSSATHVDADTFLRALGNFAGMAAELRA